MSFQVKAPATSANLGLGFDSMGIALNKFLTIEAELSDKWQVFFHDEALKGLPTDEANLVLETAIKVAAHYGKELPFLKIEMWSEIPLTHGLGSSSSAIVAGVELANHFCELNLTEYDKIKIGSEIEGHPDNVGACVTGGVFIGAHDQELFVYEQITPSNVGVVVSVPPYELSTAVSRSVLPLQYDKADAVMQNALNNVMVLALLKSDYQKMGQLMMRDRLHEPYRKPSIVEFELVKSLVLDQGAYASVISGAGPTILTLCPLDKVNQIVKQLKEVVPNCQHEGLEIFNKEQ